MSETSSNGARNVVFIILLVVGLANLGYGIFRMTEGAEMSPALFIAGTMCLTMAVVLKRTGK